MKILITPSSKFSRILYTVLLSVAGALIVLLLTGTIFAAFRSSEASPLFRLGKTETGETTAQIQNGDIRVFSGLGRLRIQLSDSSVLVLSIAFPYNAGDTAFTEELAAKTGEFRNIASGYFSSLPDDKLIHLDEEAAKTEILKNLNAALRLGSIETLYFSDMMIIDGS